jgi:hypothetical protein
MKKGRQYISATRPSYDSALTQFLTAQIAARECGRATDEAEKEIRNLFERIKGERDRAENAQRQTLNAKVTSLVNAAAGLKKTDPTIGRSLAVAAYSILPSRSTASLLHDYLSDTSLNTYTRFKRPFSMPSALDDRTGIIYGPRSGITKYDINSDSLQKKYLQINESYIIGSDISADGEIATGYVIRNDADSANIYIISPKTGRMKLLETYDRDVYRIKLTSNKNAVVIFFRDSSIVVCDTTGKKLAYKKLSHMIYSLCISCNGRYIAYATDFFGRKLKYLDCQTNKEDSTRELENPIRTFSFSTIKEERLFVGNGQAINAIDVIDGTTIDSFDIRQTIKYIAPFNLSGKWACSTDDNNVLLLDEQGKIIDQLFMDPGKKILGLSLSSLDSSLLIGLSLDETVVWKFKRVPDLIRTIENEKGPSRFMHAMLESGKILAQQSESNVQVGNKQYILLTNERGDTQALLDSSDLVDFSGWSFVNYSDRYKRLVLARKNIIIVNDLATGKRFSYDTQWGGGEIPGFAVSPDFKWIARVEMNTVNIYSTTTKSKPTTFYVSSRITSRVCFWKDRLLVSEDSKIVEYSFSGIRGPLFTTTKDFFLANLFSSADGKYVFTTTHAGIHSNNVQIFSELGHRLNTINCPDVTSISVSESGNSYYVVSDQQIQERKLPAYSIAGIPENTIEEKIKYQVPGALEKILKSKNVINLAEAARFSLQNYYETLAVDDLRQFKEIVARLEQSAGESTFHRIDDWTSLRNLQRTFDDDVSVHKKEKEIVNKLVFKFSK